jgi:hypothetical protein
VLLLDDWVHAWSKWVLVNRFTSVPGEAAAIRDRTMNRSDRQQRPAQVVTHIAVKRKEATAK